MASPDDVRANSQTPHLDCVVSLVGKNHLPLGNPRSGRAANSSKGSDLEQATGLWAGCYGLGKWLRYQVRATRVDESFVPAPELRVEVDGIPAREYRRTKDLLTKEKALSCGLPPNSAWISRCASTKPERGDVARRGLARSFPVPCWVSHKPATEWMLTAQNTQVTLSASSAKGSSW